MRWICLAGILAAVVLAGCSGNKPAPRDVKPVEEVGRADTPRPADAGNTIPVQPTPIVGVPVRTGRAADPERYEAALLEAVDFLADRKYPEALAALEKAQKFQDTGVVQREIDKVRAVLVEQAASEKAVADVRTVLEEGKPDEAARLAGDALSLHGGGDRGDDLTRLKQQADAVVSAGMDDTDSRVAKLKAEAKAALDIRNLRGAAVALEQALALGADAAFATQLDDIRARLKDYDDNRAAAIELRRDPTRLEEGLACLRKAVGAWDTLQVRQEIDEYQLILEKRRDRVAVADFEVRGEVGVPAAGRAVAEELLGHFKPRFDVVERSQLRTVLDELRLTANDLTQGVPGREVSRLAKVRYLVVGSVTPLAGVTVQARLVEASTGLVVQTARVSAPSMDALLPLLKRVAGVLQMSDEQKLAFEANLQAEAAEVRPLDSAPMDTIPPPPPAGETVLAAPILTLTDRPAVLGGVVIQDFAALPPVAVTAPSGVLAYEAFTVRTDPRRNRLLRLSLELGDNLFRRGRYREAQRQYSLAYTLTGPRREIALRLDSCRDALPPPLPPALAAIAPAPRPRLAIFGFVLGAQQGAHPVNAGDWAADHFASYCGDYEPIDRGEVAWHMGRLGLSVRDVLRDAVSRRYLAQSLNARYFVFMGIQQTASFDVNVHLIDAESGTRRGTAMIHVQDHLELKLRMHELVRQVGVNPAEQKILVAQGKLIEKSLGEARLLIKKEPARAADLLRAALKITAGNIALNSLLAEADAKQRLTAFDAAQRKDAAERATSMREAQKRREEFAERLTLARQRAADEAKKNPEAVRKVQAQHERAALLLRKQATQAIARGDSERAVRLLQGAVALKADGPAFRELAQAQIAAEKTARHRAEIEQKKRDAARQAQFTAALVRVQEHKVDRQRIDTVRSKAQDAHDLALHDSFVKQAKDQLAKKNFEAAVAAAQSARRVKASTGSARLVQQVEEAALLADAEKRGAEAKRKLEEQRKQRETAALQAKRTREAYLESMKKGEDAVAAKKYTDAVGHFQTAVKLFRTDTALGKLKSADDLRKSELAAVAAKEAETKKASRVKELVSQADKAMTAKDFAKAAALYRDASKLSPGNVDALSGLGRAERERDAETARVRREREEKTRRTAFETQMKSGKANLSANKFPQAAGNFREALKLYPADGEAKTLLAKAEAGPGVKPILDSKAKQREEDYQLAMGAARDAVKKNNLVGAVNSFKEALRLKPGDQIATDGLASAQKLLQAEDAKKKPIAPPPANPQVEFDKFIQQGTTLEKQRKYADAATAYRQALKWVAKPPAGNAQAFKAWMGVGRSEHAARRYTEAVKACEEALKRMPNQADAKAALQRAKAGKP